MSDEVLSTMKFGGMPGEYYIVNQNNDLLATVSEPKNGRETTSLNLYGGKYHGKTIQVNGNCVDAHEIFGEII